LPALKNLDAETQSGEAEGRRAHAGLLHGRWLHSSGRRGGILGGEHECAHWDQHVGSQEALSAPSHHTRRSSLIKGFEDVTFGVHTEKDLNFLVEDDDVEPLGHFCVRGPVAFARKRHPRWTSIYCGVPVMPAGIVRNIIEDTGVHIYNEDDDILYANRSYVAVFTRSAGHKTVRLPEPRTAREVFSGQMLTEGTADCFSWDAGRYRTYLFELT